MQITEILQTYQLTNADSPRLDLELLLTKVLNRPRAFIYTDPYYQLSASELIQFNDLYRRRSQGEPVAYLLGKWGFWKWEFAVNASVLVPRPATELLITLALTTINQPQARVADWGTGSGAIAISLAKERPNWQIIATDNCPAALQIAQANARTLNATTINFYLGDWARALPPDEPRFDAIVTNPPYLMEQDPHLLGDGVGYEPRSALVAEQDGLAAIRTIIQSAPAHLRPGGALIMEHGHDQSATICQLLRNAPYSQIRTYPDLAGIDRAIVAIAES